MMKKIVLALAIICAVSSAAHSIENPWNKKLPFKQGVVNYEISGTMKGSEIVFVKDYGATTAAYRFEVTSMFGVNTQTTELTLTTPDWVYTVDLSDNTGSKQINPKKVIIEKFNSLSSLEQKKLVKNSKKMGITMVGNLSGKVEKGAAKLLGYKCDKVTMMGMESYTLAGTDFPIKISGSMMGISVVETATKITKQKVSSSKFKIPKGADIIHEPQADQMIREQINTMFSTILLGKQPKNPQEKAADKMKDFQNNGGMDALQQQIKGLFGSEK